jgi:hypothetical protein
MKNPLMFMDQQKLYCEKGSITKSNVQIQCNSHQNFNVIFHRNRKICPKTHMEAKKSP